jgi:hypothetical protein
MEPKVAFDSDIHMDIPSSALEGMYALQDKKVLYSDYLVYCTGSPHQKDAMFAAVLEVLKVYQLSTHDLAGVLIEHLREQKKNSPVHAIFEDEAASCAA